MTDIKLGTTRASHYVSTVCQPELAALFAHYSKAATPQFDEDGLTVYQVPDERHGRTVLLFHDAKPGRRPDIDKPEAVKGLHRALHFNRSDSMIPNHYSLYTLASYHSDILALVAQISNSIAAAMRQSYVSACSIDESAMQDALRLASVSSAVMQWTKDTGYVFEFANPVETARQAFCDLNYDVFMLDGVFMLTDSSSGMAYVAREEAGGLTWYGEHLDYGVRQDEEGDEAHENRIPFAMERYFLKHIFRPENRVAFTVDGTLVAVDAKIDVLSRSMAYICNELGNVSVSNLASPTS
jgi:hypothetical protein